MKMGPQYVLQVANWSQNFENNRTRELKQMTFVCIPNKMDGDGYTELLDHVDGDRHYACWIAIVAVASKCEPRGTLLRESRTILRDSDDALRDGARPHTAESLCRISRMKIEVMKAAIERLVSIGWLERKPLETEEVIEIPQEGAGIPQGDAEKRLRNGMEWNGMEENGIKGSNDPQAGAMQVDDSVVMEFPVVGSGAKTWQLMASKVAEYAETYPHLDLMGELRAARQWCIDNREKRKTHGGMVRFLGRWLAKAQNSHGGAVDSRRAANRSSLTFDGIRTFLESSDESI